MGTSRQWKDLLDWLQGHGMDVSLEGLLVNCKSRPRAGHGLFSLQSIPPSTPLFTVPSTALINEKTLSPHYPSGSATGPRLTATQLISLHLFLHRPGSGVEDRLFGPYISILPGEFNSHPLTWRVTRDIFPKNASVETNLLDDLPPSATAALTKSNQRFWEDWRVVSKYIQENLRVLNKSLACHHRAAFASFQTDECNAVMDFLWAWLNVNTRCIYYRLKPSCSDPDNLTLCPILDFANHTITGPRMFPAPNQGDICIGPRQEVLTEGLTLLSPPDTVIAEGQELYLTYGGHCNRTLFVEYGFVIDIPSEPTLRAEFAGEIDVEDLVEYLLEAQGESASWMKVKLVEEGYWGDWTLHSSPQPAHPSYRLITALRLYRLPEVNTDRFSPQDSKLKPWRDTLLGKQDIISERNELEWRATLVEICSVLAGRSFSRLSGALAPAQHTDENEWLASIRADIRTLWEEELIVAAAVADSVQKGETF